MIPLDDYPTIEAMEKYGGSFIKALANACRHADPDNYRRLQIAFPEYFKRYARMAKEVYDVKQNR